MTRPQCLCCAFAAPLANLGIAALARSRALKDTRASVSWEFACARVRGDATDFFRHDQGAPATGPAVAAAGSVPVLCWCPSRSAAPASGPISAKATGVRPAAGFVRCGCGGGPIAFLARGRRCPFAGSALPTPGVKIPPIGAITARSGGRPMNQATVSGATTPSTTFFSNSITTHGPVSPVAAVPCSFTSPGQAWRRPPAVSPCAVTTFWHWSGASRRKTRIIIHF